MTTMDFEIERSARVCAATGRALGEGEEFFSILVREGRQIVRRDYALEAWTGPPDDAVASWKSRIPERHAKPKLAPRDVVLRLFDALGQSGEQADLRYMLALWLMRRRILKPEPAAGEGSTATGRDVLALYDPSTETIYQVPVALPAASRAAELEREMSRLLGIGQPAPDEPSPGAQP
ncbi:MAG TPA: hypothetical protein VG713_20445 [Pirellulales bacterium]|nr:hypothetical protein [Pirellulales bacterium]